MSKQLTREERLRRVHKVYSAVNHSDKRKRKTVTQACKDLGLTRSTYNRWKKSLDGNPEWGKDGVVPAQSRAPKQNGMALSAGVRQRIEDMARSSLYANPSQIGKALRKEGTSVSDNTVRNNLEAAGPIWISDRRGKRWKADQEESDFAMRADFIRPNSRL